MSRRMPRKWSLVLPLLTMACASADGRPHHQSRVGGRCGYECDTLAGRALEALGDDRSLRAAAMRYDRAITAGVGLAAIYSPSPTVGGRGQTLILDAPDGRTGEAEFRLGMMLAEGRGVPTDPERAANLILIAARRGFAPALEEVARHQPTGPHEAGKRGSAE